MSGSYSHIQHIFQKDVAIFPLRISFIYLFLNNLDCLRYDPLQIVDELFEEVCFTLASSTQNLD